MSLLNRPSHSESLSNIQRFHPKRWLSLFDLASCSFIPLCLDNCGSIYSFPCCLRMWLWDSVISNSQHGSNDFFMICWFSPGPFPPPILQSRLCHGTPLVSSPQRLPRPPPRALAPAALVVKCLTWPCSGLTTCQNQHAVRTLGFFRADPKISIYPDVDILMSNGAKLRGHTVGGRAEFRIPLIILELDRDIDIVHSNHHILR